jgi:hypothetical protein
MALDQHARCLTPHPAGFSSIVATTLVVLAAFLAGSADAGAPPPPTSGRMVAAARSATRVHRPLSRPAPRPSGPSAAAVTPDSLYDAGDSLAEHCEASRHGAGRDRAVLCRGADVGPASRPRARAGQRRSVGRRRRPTPPSVVPRAPPGR